MSYPNRMGRFNMMSEKIERWDIFELALNGPSIGNPFVDISLSATFQHEHRTVKANGFYDGNGIYRVRFMPDAMGEWTYETGSNHEQLDGVAGAFTCVAPPVQNQGIQNHGPVHVRNTHHFAYADGTPYISVGTTCYAWAHQGDALEEQTLSTLKDAPFNKLRMCVFPKDYTYSRNEPAYYPFERDEDGAWDFSRFNPAFFQHFEERVGQLRELGIEADIILFHPYDRWGFANMGAENDDRYLRYLVARLSAYRNVWWSMANEYDLVPGKHEADWDRFFRIVQESDPHQHLRSIHNCREFYDHAKPWVTHQSIQHNDVSRTAEWRARCKKPVVIDECKYEGNVEQRWGNISAREMVHRFWLATVGGGYAGHSETYLHPDDILWWSKGGVLHGESPARIAFLRQLLEASGCRGLDPVHPWGAGVEGEYYLFYCGVAQPGAWTLELPRQREYKVDLIDTWAMTISPFEETYTGKFTLPMPTKSHMALQVRALDQTG